MKQEISNSMKKEARNQKVMKQWIDQSKNRSIDKGMNQWTMDWVNQWSKWIKEPTNQRIKESMGQWIHKSNIPVHLCDFIFQKCSDPLSALRFFDMQIEHSLLSPLQILPTWSSKSAPRPLVSNVFTCKSGSCHSLVHLVPRWSSKSAQLWPFQKANRALTDNFPRSRRPQEPHYAKKRAVSRPRMSSPVNSHASGLLNFPTTWWWVADMMMGGWHDDVVDMMLWTLTTTLVRHSAEVFSRNFLW